ncbi:MAG: succinate dehydrogenase, hydrophobic membrane anchor protein [Gammaproteobacteria bacterium]|nr:succinate dehydrogenase, hydrophobic membrane anchor protein [Gammaproteobacteria bacterium]MBI5617649.1 succinate dehydrogenase, hydrophobic membrane anchor protein [Gammaproteobacteria bacterium]
MSLRSPLGRVRGLGSAKSGLSHWRWQRITALALIPLGLWFVYILLELMNADHAQVVAFFRSPCPAALAIGLVVALFYHMKLGLQVVVEDYVHGHVAQVALQVALRLGTALGALLALVSILKLSLGSA